MQFNVKDHGAVGNGETEDTKAVQSAIDACTRAGGGRVYAPPGLYMIGSIELKDNVELHLERGATFRAIYDSENFRPVSPAENPLTALVFARDAANIAISGGGTIDGQGPRYWRKLDKPRSGRKDVDEVGAIQFWYEHINDIRKPNRILAFLRCRQLKISDISLTGSTEWTCHLIGSRDVKIHRIDIKNPLYGPNTDGIDVDSSSDVLISDCTIETGDDAVVLKTKNIFDINKPIRNVCATNNRFITGCNGYKIGTETENDVENITFSNSTIYNPADSLLTERCISGIAIETVDGGNVSNVSCSNITMINSRTPLFIRLGARLRGKATAAGSLRGVALSNIIATGATHPSVISGIPGHLIEDVQIANMQIGTKGGFTGSLKEIGEIPENPDHYPEVFMFGTVPAAVMYLRHIDNIAIQSLFTRVKNPDSRPLLFADDVKRMNADPDLF